MHFYILHGFICDFLEFPSVKSSQYIESGKKEILNLKKVGFVQTVFLVFFFFANSFTAEERLVR